MSIVALDHIQLAIPSGGEQRAIEFYAGALGIPQVPKPAPLAARGGCWFEDGNVRVHVGIDRHFRAARKAHPAFVVDNLDALISRLGAAGFPARVGEVIDGRRRAFVDDPFGNRIELMEPPVADGTRVTP
jgi:catechol 2,3-dioxygenase-like lactoylglutathione lyase family enzyme